PSGGGEDSTPDATSKPQGLSIGDTAATDKAEFVLKEFEFTNGLYNSSNDLTKHLIPLTDEEIDALDSGVYQTDDGKVLAYMEFTIKNTGKTKLENCWVKTEDGHTSYVGGYVELDYNDYLFRALDDNGFMIDITAIEKGHTTFIGNNSTLELDVLEDAHTYRGCIKVPEQVMNDTDKSLSINIYLPCENGEFETFTYKIR
ncbi:hypothetical protein, partial [Pseudoflavonifractor sp. 524-17]|uniref:hypothetical protein n=1 Tax=Pseudoflavonifractor sp. 524-17 TaxID=2304577 RepID=UPI00137B2AA7